MFHYYSCCFNLFLLFLQLRQHLDGLLTQLKELPARLRQYASYEYVKRTLQSFTKVKFSYIFVMNRIHVSLWSNT